MECPPASSIPAREHTNLAPSSTLAASSGASFSTGQLKIALANRGLPPMAYTSEMALVAAMRPKSNGSSTMGVKKSTVLITAISSDTWYTAASSLLELPTSNRGSACTKDPLAPRIWSNTAGAILQPQPDPSLHSVNRMVCSIAFWFCL